MQTDPFKEYLNSRSQIKSIKVMHGRLRLDCRQSMD